MVPATAKAIASAAAPSAAATNAGPPVGEAVSAPATSANKAATHSPASFHSSSSSAVASPPISNPRHAVGQRYQANISGCERCLQGYRGRIGIFELCQPEAFNSASPSVRHGNKETWHLRDIALGCYNAGNTSLDEVNRVVPEESGSHLQ